MKKLFFFSLITLIIASCGSKTENPLQAEVTSLRQILAQKQDSLEMYNKLPFTKVENPLNKSESILLKDPQSWVAFDSTMKQIDKVSNELSDRESFPQKLIVQIELSLQKEEQLIKNFKKQNSSFCERWAYSMLDYELGVLDQSEEDFESNPALVKMRETIASFNATDSVYDTKMDKLRDLKEGDIKNAWETFKKRN
jgi:hypothetical protein